jgi:hypothetical protein
MTSVSLYGAYNDTEPEFAAPRFGHPKRAGGDRRWRDSGVAPRL